ncbi:hypothetical protein [Clostridium senegalense]
MFPHRRKYKPKSSKVIVLKSNNEIDKSKIIAKDFMRDWTCGEYIIDLYGESSSIKSLNNKPYNECKYNIRSL